MDRGWNSSNKRESLPHLGALGSHVCRNVLVIGKGKPHHITAAEAIEWVKEGKAKWQKPGRRIKYIAGKCLRPLVRDLSCCVDPDVLAALRDRRSENHNLAYVFVNQTRRNRERVSLRTCANKAVE